jgi:uncharacterized protein (DUF58 family)
MTERLLEPEFLTKLQRLMVLSRKVFAGKMKGERRSRQKGTSVEFADYRNYVFGDDPRFIDWNTYARLERLFLKLFLEEEDLFVYILLDGSASMTFGTPSKFLYAKRVAAALGYITLMNLDRLSVGTFDSDLREFLPATRGKGQGEKLFRFLADLEAEGKTSLAGACKRFLVRNKRPGLLILLSDFFDRAGFEEAIRLLISRRLEIFAIQILAQEEIQPQLSGDLKLIDAEERDETEITVSERLLKTYHERLEGFCEGLRNHCIQRGIHYLRISTAMPFEDVVLHYLKTAGLLK